MQPERHLILRQEHPGLTGLVLAFKEGAVTMTPSPQPDSLVLDDENLCLRVVHSPRWEVLAQELLDDLLWIFIPSLLSNTKHITFIHTDWTRRYIILTGATR